MSFVHALKWSFLAELASKAITPIVFIVLARLLTPEDFGVMSAALMVIAFSQIFWEAGMGKALIQRQTDVEDAANIAFWVNSGLGILIAGLIFWGATPIALTFFQDDRVTAVLQVMTLQVLLGALSSVQTALLQKQMGFKKLFWVRLMTVALPSFASIPLAWYGMGYWALVGGTLTGQAFQVFLLWRVSSWRPALRFPFVIAKQMVQFGSWVGAYGILGWFYLWADSLVVGKYLGIHDLGLYRNGNQFAIFIFGVFFSPVLPVLYSHLSRIKEEPGRLIDNFLKVSKVTTLLSVSTAIVIYSFSKQIGLALFGQQWEGIGFVIGVLALSHGFSWVAGLNGEIYRAMGKPSYETIVSGSTLLIYLAVYIYAIQISFEVFVWARFGLAIFALILHLYLLDWILNIRVTLLLAYSLKIAVVALCIVTSINLIVTDSLENAWSILIIGVLGSMFCLGGALYIIERNGVVRGLLEMARNSRD